MPNYDQTQALVEFDGRGGVTKPAQPATGSIVVNEYGNSVFHGADVVLTSVPVVMTYNGTVNGGAGSQVLMTLPKGLDTVLSAMGSLTISSGTQLGATAALVVSCGTVAATTSSALTSTTANVIASTAATFVTNASAPKPKMTGTEFAAAVFDGTTTANSFYLNAAVAPAGITATGTLTVSGFMRLTWANGGGLITRTS